MRALILDDQGRLRLDDAPVPKPEPGEALIRVFTAGICNTDLELVKGYMGFRGIPGHEFVGVVEQCGNEHLRGKRVVGEINCVCHQCHYCELEIPHHCTRRSVLGILKRNGAFAEYVTLPEENLHLVPNSMRDDVAVFTEPTAAAFRILEQVSVDQEDRVIVLGDGKLGQLIAQVLWLHTKRLVCIGRHRSKLALLEKLKIAAVLDTEPVEPGADLVVDATGSSHGLGRALELVRPEGTIVLKTTVAQGMTADMSLSVINEVHIVGSRCGPFRPALEALTLGNVEVRPMVSEHFKLEDGVEAFDRARDPEVLKVLIHV
ncbi:MAG: alcohol dehydrogenase catalytic domain-containing protein [Candidatus Hydrogenedentes bacterium]|nr:alcohol dehydrogenase catalytic domain-containing protein [Candidatus Hydrogenedentota bacterium]